jgi:excisionase family DNA binding protein
MNIPLAYSINEACSAAAIGRTCIYELIGRGEIRAIKRGRRTLIRADDLQRWLDGLPHVEPKITPDGSDGA